MWVFQGAQTRAEVLGLNCMRNNVKPFEIVLLPRNSRALSMVGSFWLPFCYSFLISCVCISVLQKQERKTEKSPETDCEPPNFCWEPTHNKREYHEPNLAWQREKTLPKHCESARKLFMNPMRLAEVNSKMADVEKFLSSTL